MPRGARRLRQLASGEAKRRSSGHNVRWGVSRSARTPTFGIMGPGGTAGRDV